MEEELYNQAVTLRHELHRHPELSGQEKWTKQHLMDFLRSHTKRLELVDCGSWFYAVYRGTGEKKLAFRADFDALPIDETISLPYGSEYPSVAHKCGHDGHSAGLAAFAAEAERRGSDNTLYFIFQHAEEIGAGAEECAKLIDREQIDEIYGYHNAPGWPADALCVRDGTIQCASVGVSLFFEGKTSHAAEPEAGISPAPAISRIVLALPELCCRENYSGFVLATVIQIKVGEAAFGTSPGSGVLRLTLRAERENELYILRDRLLGMAESLCAEYGLTYRAEYCDFFPENRNDDSCNAKLRAIGRKLGLQVIDWAEPMRASEDFGRYTKCTKGAFFDVGIGTDAPLLHTVEYDFRDETMRTVNAVFAELAELKPEK